MLSTGSFGRNVLIVSAGNGLGYAIGFLLTPIIARLYPPEVYGEFALFNTIAAHISIIATFGYQSTLVLGRNEKEVKNLIHLCIRILLIVSCFSCIFLLPWGRSLLRWLKVDDLLEWGLVIPILVFLIGISRILEYINVRNKDFIKNASSKFGTVVTSKLIAIISAVAITANAGGLLLGEVGGRLIGSLLLFGKSFRESLTQTVRIGELKVIGQKYRNYPLYILPSNFIQIISKQLPIYIFSWYFGSQVTGWFSISLSTVNLPIIFLGSAVAYVFYQKAAEINDRHHQLLKQKVGDFFRYLVPMGAVPFAILTVFGADLFTWFFGENWREAGIYAQYLGVMGFFQLVSQSIASLYRILNQERLLFQLNLIGALALSIGLVMGILAGNPLIMIIIYAVIISIQDFVIIIMVFRKLNLHIRYFILYTAGIFVFATGLLFLLKLSL